MRQLVGGRAVKHGAASASAMGRFETEILTRPDNLAALADLPGRWIDAVHDRRPPKSITLDMDSSESPVHGDQEGAAWNGHFQSKCLHPLFVFNQYGDLERCALRPGNVHSADGWECVLKPVLSRYSAEGRPSITRRRFRADAAFAASCDTPLLDPKFVRRMVELLADHDIAAPIDGSMHHPLAAVYRTRVLPHIERLRASDRMRPIYLFDEVDTLG